MPGRNARRPEEVEFVEKLDEGAAANPRWWFAQPGQAALAGVRLLGQKCVEPSARLGRQKRGNVGDDFVVGGVHGRGRHALDDADAGYDDVSAPHLIDEPVKKCVSIGHAERLRFEPGRQLGPRRAGQVAKAVPPLDGGDLLVACGATSSKTDECVRPDADLLGDVVEHDRGQHLAAAEIAAGEAQRTELERIAESGLWRARLADHGEVIGIEAMVAHDLVFGGRQRQDRLALSFGHRHARRHDPAPIANRLPYTMPMKEDCERPSLSERPRVCGPQRKRTFVEGADQVLIGYARVSKGDEQSNAAQVAALRRAECEQVFEEKASGGRWDRPELQRMLGQLRRGDIVVVWKLDRLSRSLKDLLHILEKVEAAGAGFRSLTESIDTTVPAGRMMMQMVGAFAESSPNTAGPPLPYNGVPTMH